MAIWNNSDDLKELRSEFEHLKGFGTEERIVKDDSGLYYKRFFKITEYKITEASSVPSDNSRYVLASWRADIIYTKDVRTESAAEKAIFKQPDSWYVDWEAVFKQTPERVMWSRMCFIRYYQLTAKAMLDLPLINDIMSSIGQMLLTGTIKSSLHQVHAYQHHDVEVLINPP